MVEKSSAELMTYRFLPLQMSEVWEDVYEDNPDDYYFDPANLEPTMTTAAGARNAYNVFLHASLMDTRLRSAAGEKSWSGGNNPRYSNEFWFDAWHGGLRFLSVSYSLTEPNQAAGAFSWMANRADDYHRGGRLWPAGANPVGNIGNRNGDHRYRWWYILYWANRALHKADGLQAGWNNPGMVRKDPLLNSAGRETFLKQYRHPIAAWHKDSSNRHTPDLFIFNPDIPNDPNFIANGTQGNQNPRYWLMPVNIMKRLAYVHDQMYSTRLGEAARQLDRHVWAIKQDMAWTMIRNVERGNALLETMFQLRDSALEAALQREEVALVAGAGEDFQLEMLTDDEVDVLVERPEYVKYFSTTFNQDVITFVPIIHNFHLTSKYFQNISDAFVAPNNLALDILISTIKGQEGFRTTPNLSRPAAQNTIASQLGQNTGSSAAARDFILKMLVMAPINILKGLCELIDPHVAISKLIKIGTGKAFNELSTVLDAPAEGINEANRQLIINAPAGVPGMPGCGGNAENCTDAENYRGIDGEDLLTFILCILDLLMQNVEEAMPDDYNPPKGFFPRIKKTGVDFTGTVSGLLMIPPLPFGLIYLLLGLIKFGDDDVEDVSDAPPTDPEGCAPPEVIDIPGPGE